MRFKLGHVCFLHSHANRCCQAQHEQLDSDPRRSPSSWKSGKSYLLGIWDMETLVYAGDTAACCDSSAGSTGLKVSGPRVFEGERSSFLSVLRDTALSG